MKVFMGFDPGTKGFVSMIAEDGTFVKAEPIFKDIKVVDMIETANRLLAFVEGYEVRHVVIEDVHALYGSSAKGTFTFGYNSCVPEFFCAIADYPIQRYRLKMAVGHAQGYKDGNKKRWYQDGKGREENEYRGCTPYFPGREFKTLQQEPKGR